MSIDSCQCGTPKFSDSAQCAVCVLTAENTRLREALDAICKSGGCCEESAEMRRIARSALGTK